MKEKARDYHAKASQNVESFGSDAINSLIRPEEPENVLFERAFERTQFFLKQNRENKLTLDLTKPAHERGMLLDFTARTGSFF